MTESSLVEYRWLRSLLGREVLVSTKDFAPFDLEGERKGCPWGEGHIYTLNLHGFGPVRLLVSDVTVEDEDGEEVPRAWGQVGRDGDQGFQEGVSYPLPLQHLHLQPIA